MRIHPYLLTSASSSALCSMTKEGEVEDLGGTQRVVTGDGGAADAEATARAAQGAGDVQKDLKGKEPEGKGKTVEEVAAEAEAAKVAAAEGKEAVKEGDKASKDFDLKGTIFEGLSPDMQGKISPFAAAYAENGSLTDAEITEAASATGFSEAAVRQFMRGADIESQDATATKNKPIYDVAGGAEQFAAFQAWTLEAGNITEAEERAVNKVLAEDPEAGATLLSPLLERWKAAGGGEAARDLAGKGKEGGEGPNASKALPFKSWAEQQVAQSDPRYQSDPAFRDEVYARIAVSKF